jgi:hypothetical protein
MIVACIILPPLIPIAVGLALGGTVGVAIAAAIMALVSGVGGIIAGYDGDRDLSQMLFTIAGVFAVLGPLEIFARRAPRPK